jgi:hypothetical protein
LAASFNRQSGPGEWLVHCSMLRRFLPLLDRSAFGSVLTAVPFAQVFARRLPGGFGSFLGRYKTRLIPDSHNKYCHSENFPMPQMRDVG